MTQTTRKMNKTYKVSKPGTVSRNAETGRITNAKHATSHPKAGAETARQFASDFYKKHGKAMSELANE